MTDRWLSDSIIGDTTGGGAAVLINVGLPDNFSQTDDDHWSNEDQKARTSCDARVRAHVEESMAIHFTSYVTSRHRNLPHANVLFSVWLWSVIKHTSAHHCTQCVFFY